MISDLSSFPVCHFEEKAMKLVQTTNNFAAEGRIYIYMAHYLNPREFLLTEIKIFLNTDGRTDKRRLRKRF